MLDTNDLKILSLLQNNGRMPSSAIAKQLGMATSTIHERIQKLMTRGDILGFTTRVNPPSVGLNMLAFIQVLVVDVANEIPFIEHAKSLPEVEEFYDLTGEWSYLLKVRTRNIEALSKFRREHINPFTGVVRTNTSLAMTTYKDSWEMAMDGESQNGRGVE